MLILLAAEDECRLASPTDQDLVLSTGTFSVTDQGILAKLRPPLSRLSGHHPWQFFPLGIATLKLLVMNECELNDSIAARLGLSRDEQDLLERRIGKIDCDWRAGSDLLEIEHESDFCSDVDRIIRWSVGLAAKCPYASVSRDLARLPDMQTMELDRYVRTWLS